MAIDTVLFDLDDTLHDDTTAYKTAAERVARDVAARHAIDPAALHAAYVHEAETFWKQLNAEHLTMQLSENRRLMWEAALRSVALEDEELTRRCGADYVRFRNEALVPLPGAVELLDDLRARGVKLGIVTNGFAETHHDKIALLGLTSRVDAIFIADEVGMLKPDPELFRHACRTLGTEPGRTAMVGDRYFRDVTGAHEAGLTTIYLDIHGEHRPPEDDVADAVVHDIAEVAAVLEPLLARGPGFERSERQVG